MVRKERILLEGLHLILLFVLYFTLQLLVQSIFHMTIRQVSWIQRKTISRYCFTIANLTFEYSSRSLSETARFVWLGLDSIRNLLSNIAVLIR